MAMGVPTKSWALMSAAQWGAAFGLLFAAFKYEEIAPVLKSNPPAAIGMVLGFLVGGIFVALLIAAIRNAACSKTS